MSLKTRRILYILFIMAFLIITPMVIFYAAGYKLSPGGITFQKTGSFILDSDPQGANIFINNKPQQKFFKKIFSPEESYVKTPAKIKGLLPGEYDLKIELEGYWPWQKKLSVHPGTSTYAEDVYLFKNNLPISLLSGNIKNLKISPDKNKMAILLEDGWMILDLINENQITLPVDENEIEKKDLFWAPSSKKVLINKTVFNAENFNNNNKILSLQNSNENIQWDAESDDKIYYSDKTGVNIFTLSSKTSKKIIEKQKFIDCLIQNDYIYFITEINGLVNLDIFKISSGQLIRRINVPGSANYNFINQESKLINLYDADHQILYLIDPFSSFYSPVLESISNLKYAHWVSDSKLLYANDFEIFLFNIDSGKKTLLTRISKVIESVIWHPSNNYIIYSTDESINIIELDEREKYNITEIIKLNKISFPYLNQKGGTLYFYAEIGNQEGLYKLIIQ